MKAKNILAIKERLEKATEAKNFNDTSNNSLEVRFDAYEELVTISEYKQQSTPEITMNLNEAKRLKTLLNRLV